MTIPASPSRGGRGLSMPTEAAPEYFRCGHERTAANSKRNGRKVRCRICKNVRDNASYKRRRAERKMARQQAPILAERMAVARWLRAEAGDARQAQDGRDEPTEKLYRMGQKTAYLIAAEAIERGHHVPRT